DGIRDATVTGVQTCALPISLHTMRRAESRWAIAGAGMILLVAVEQFVFCCYPRFQIPLAYLAVALLIGGSTCYRNRNESARETRSEERRVGKECRSPVRPG